MPERVHRTKKNRGKVEIIGAVMLLAADGIKKTRIMYGANLSYEQLGAYLELLKNAGLIEEVEDPEGTIYRTTARGRQFTKYYSLLTELMDEPGDTQMYTRKRAG